MSRWYAEVYQPFRVVDTAPARLRRAGSLELLTIARALAGVWSERRPGMSAQ
jgi:hypothetical protein